MGGFPTLHGRSAPSCRHAFAAAVARRNPASVPRRRPPSLAPLSTLVADCPLDHPAGSWRSPSSPSRAWPSPRTCTGRRICRRPRPWRSTRPSVGSRVYAGDDEFITEFQAEKRIFVPLQQIPPHLRNAIIAVEDSRFYSHFGVDVRGIARAAYANFRHGRVVEGGSTITQQLAKVLFLTPDRSFSRKVKEALLAFELEKRYSKDRLLELYLNQVYMGHGAFGVEAAARMYFGKSVQDLTLPEAAMLAALPRSPGQLLALRAARARPTAARDRRRPPARARVHHRDRGQGDQPRRRSGWSRPSGGAGSGQYFLEYLQQSLEAKYGSDVLYKSGLSVYTTLDRAPPAGGGAGPPRGHPVPGRAAGRPRQRPRGSPRRLRRGARGGRRGDRAARRVTSRRWSEAADFTRTEFNRALHARRQPGSAFKPFVYLAALEAGHAADRGRRRQPGPLRLRPGKVWAPENYDGKFRGPVTLQQALEESINVPTDPPPRAARRERGHRRGAAAPASGARSRTTSRSRSAAATSRSSSSPPPTAPSPTRASTWSRSWSGT